MTNTDIIDLTYIVARRMGIQLDSVKVRESKEETMTGDAYGTYVEYDFRNNKTVEIEIVNTQNDEESIYVIAHELAHGKYRNHTASHKKLTSEYEKIVKEFLN